MSTKADLFIPVSSKFGSSPVQSLALTYQNRVLVARFENGNITGYLLPPGNTTSNAVDMANPLFRVENVYNIYSMANICFSPDSKLLLCCTSGSGSNKDKNSDQVEGEQLAEVTGNSKGRLMFFDISSFLPSDDSKVKKEAKPLKEKLSLAISDEGGSGIIVRWAAATNQIFVTLSNGQVKVLYDTALSKKGALMSSKKAPKRLKDPTDFAVVGEIYNPLALPMYRNDTAQDKAKKRKAELKDPYLAKIPEKPATQGPGSRLNTSFYFTNYMMNGHAVDKTRMEDPREALLKMAEVSSKDPRYLGRAYASTQPQTLLHTKTLEEEQEEMKTKRTKTDS
jgi:hypothetical protein